MYIYIILYITLLHSILPFSGICLKTWVSNPKPGFACADMWPLHCGHFAQRHGAELSLKLQPGTKDSWHRCGKGDIFNRSYIDRV